MSSIFKADETYYQFTISTRVSNQSDNLSSTSVAWVPVRLIDTELRAVLDRDKLSKKAMSEWGNYEKVWVRALWDLCDRFEEDCVVYSGSRLDQVSNLAIRVEKQFFSCDEY
jgi:hypothetical protein